MSRQVSPFAALTGVEKQMKWLEYQSIRLPYVEASMDAFPVVEPTEQPKEDEKNEKASVQPVIAEAEAQRPQTPPEVPRVMLYDQKTRHSQYDAVIARMKQASLQSQRFQSLQATQQGH